MAEDHRLSLSVDARRRIALQEVEPVLRRQLEAGVEYVAVTRLGRGRLQVRLALACYAGTDYDEYSDPTY